MLDPHLDPKTQLLVALGAATAAKCQACFTHLYATANAVEATDKEIRAVVGIANKVAAKSRDFMSASIEETTQGAVAVSATDPQDTGCECR